ncbi:hypothetical protein ACXIUJ_23950 [Vibrio parahaemolyticus]
METTEIVGMFKDILVLFGGTSAVLIALVGFLGHISTKRIINGDLAKHKQELENLKSTNKIEQNRLANDFNRELKRIEALNAQSLELIKQEHELRLDVQQTEHNRLLENVKHEMNTAFLKSETYKMISQEMFQKLFNKRMEVYTTLLKLKNEIDKSVVDNAEMLEVHCDDPSYFTNSIKQINEASQSNLMLISNELAVLSNELYKKSSQVFSSAKVSAFYAEMGTFDHESGQSDFMAVVDAEDNELRRMFEECGELYDKWFEQLEKDISQIRLILDFSGDFLKAEH